MEVHRRLAIATRYRDALFSRFPYMPAFAAFDFHYYYYYYYYYLKFAVVARGKRFLGFK